jgi:hypothetical protein
MNADEDRILMQYLILSAEPQAGTPASDEYGGAHVGCYIKDQTSLGAFDLAKKMIQEYGWNVLELEEQYSISAQTYENKSDGKEYFEQALIDGEVIVFYTFPKNAKE